MQYEDLARKYSTLLELREAHARGEGVAPRETLRALAEEFPGALREIDRLPLDEITRRLRALDAVVQGADGPSPWMDWMCTWHDLLRATLALKRVVRKVAPDARRAERLAQQVSRSVGVTVDAAYVGEVACPPDGRLGPIVARALGAHFGVDPAVLLRALLPPKRDTFKADANDVAPAE